MDCWFNDNLVWMVNNRTKSFFSWIRGWNVTPLNEIDILMIVKSTQLTVFIGC